MRLKHYILVAIAVLILLPLAVVYGVLRASLPQLDGSLRTAGLAAPVKIERDRLGAPTLPDILAPYAAARPTNLSST